MEGTHGMRPHLRSHMEGDTRAALSHYTTETAHLPSRAPMIWSNLFVSASRPLPSSTMSISSSSPCTSNTDDGPTFVFVLQPRELPWLQH